MDTRLKWVGLLHRSKRTPGRFMMRLRTPNGVVNSDLMRFYADSVEKYGPEIGVVDITTRQNIQLRGVALEDADTIIDGLHARNQTSIQSALDNVRNMVGSPLAGIDPLELVDTRPYCEALNDLITLDPETGKRGNPVWGNLPRKFNICVSGGRDDFAHTHINDIGLVPTPHATTGAMGFNVVLGGYMSIKRVAEAVPMGLWIPAEVSMAVELSRAILRIFRDEGTRGDRQKARLMWLVESYGIDAFREAVRELCSPAWPPLKCTPGSAQLAGTLLPVATHRLVCTPEATAWQVVEEMTSYGIPEGTTQPAQPAETTPFERRELLGVHVQQQPSLRRVGVHVSLQPLTQPHPDQPRDARGRAPTERLACAGWQVPTGRLHVNECRQLADLADKYSGGEIRLTVEQNVLLPNVPEDKVVGLLAEPSLNEGRLSVSPGHIVGHTVSCTGSQFCGARSTGAEVPFAPQPCFWQHLCTSCLRAPLTRRFRKGAAAGPMLMPVPEPAPLS